MHLPSAGNQTRLTGPHAGPGPSMAADLLWGFCSGLSSASRSGEGKGTALSAPLHPFQVLCLSRMVQAGFYKGPLLQGGGCMSIPQALQFALGNTWKATVLTHLLSRPITVSGL